MWQLEVLVTLNLYLHKTVKTSSASSLIPSGKMKHRGQLRLQGDLGPWHKHHLVAAATDSLYNTPYSTVTERSESEQQNKHRGDCGISTVLLDDIALRQTVQHLKFLLNDAVFFFVLFFAVTSSTASLIKMNEWAWVWIRLCHLPSVLTARGRSHITPHFRVSRSFE